MILIDLLGHSKNFPIFDVEDCQKWFPNTNRGVLLVQLSHYVKQGYLLRLRRGLYLLNSGAPPDKLALAAQLRTDAVISLETVLSENGLIPETALGTTALTVGRNTTYTVPPLGNFIFRHIASALLFGWRLRSLPPYSARVATIEKALLDVLWFHSLESEPMYYLQESRLSIPNHFSWAHFRALAKQFNNRRLWKLAMLTEKIFK